jgi:hypothetical protein
MTMKVVGQLRQTPWERFVRLQATTALITKGKGQPRGVYRFSTYEESDRWKAKQRTT